MAEFVAFEVVPILAIFWIVTGSVGFTFVVAISIHHFVRGKPVRIQGTEELAPSGDLARLNARLGGAFLFFGVMGYTFLKLGEQQARGPQLVLSVFGALHLFGGLLALFILWRARRQPT